MTVLQTVYTYDLWSVGRLTKLFQIEISDILKSMRRNMMFLRYVKKGKSVPFQGPRCPEGSRKLRFPDYVTMDRDGGKGVSLTRWTFLPPGDNPGSHFC